MELFRPRPQRPSPPEREAARGADRDVETRAVAEFSRHYGLTFRDPKLLKLALTHRSYLHVTGQRDSNERLEFLGDSVLGLVTSEFLYRAHPTEHEGQLTKTKSLLVSKAILSRRALAMGLGRFVLMSHSEVESGGRQRLSILADAFESVVGAIYLDQGFEASRAFIERWLLRDTRTIVADKRHTNYKSHLQEYVQSTYRTHPVYRIRAEMGPDHSKQFTVEVIVGRRTLGQGKGRNKKEAEQAAARDALEQVERPPSDLEREEEARRPAETEERPRRAAPQRPAPPRPAVDEEEDEEEDDGTLLPGADTSGDVISRRRRRGRRGGRGRRRPESTPSESAAPPAPAPRETAPPPVAPVSRPVSRPEPPRPSRLAGIEPARPEMPRAAEIEPLPPAYVEDELDDVGRPEGPSGERFEPSWFSTPVPAPRHETPAEPERRVPEQPAREESVESEVEDVEAAEVSEGGHPAEPDRTSPPAPPAPAPESPRPSVQYGRRGGKSRRPG